jgi:flagellar biosynthesis protein FlhA
MEVGRYELQPGCELAIQAAQTSVVLSGALTREPAFNMPAVWITADQVDKARQNGYTVVDPVSVVGTHLIEVIRRNACGLFTRQETKRFLDRVAQDHPKVVEDLVPKLVSLAAVQKVIQNLLRERVSIRDSVSILEALGEGAAITRNQILLSEFVRQQIRRNIVKPHLNQAGDLAVYFVDAEIERLIEGAVEHGEHNSHLNLAPQQIRALVERFQRALQGADGSAVVLTSSSVRYFVRQVTEYALPSTTVLGHNEVPPGVRVIAIGTVK